MVSYAAKGGRVFRDVSVPLHASSFRRWRNRFVHVWARHGTAVVNAKVEWNGMELCLYIAVAGQEEAIACVIHFLTSEGKTEEAHACVAKTWAFVLARGQELDCHSILPTFVQTRAAVRSRVLELPMS